MFSRNQVFCLKNWKLWRAPTTIDFNNFCWNFAHVPYLPILFRTWVVCQNQKITGFCTHTHTETSFINNSRNKHNKKYPTHLFIDIGKTETWEKFQQKILNFTVACQSFQFFRQITWFLRNARVLSKFKYCILHFLISIIKLKNN